MTKPLLLMDVDGVLCPFMHGKFVAFDGSEPWVNDPSWQPNAEGYSQHPKHGVFWSPNNTTRILRLMENFDMAWCTGWGRKANEVISPMHHLPPFKTVSLSGYSRGRGMPHWKGHGIVEHVGDRAFAFVDDDINRDTIRWAERRTENGVPTLCLPTHPDTGLTDEHVTLLEVFAAGVAFTST